MDIESDKQLAENLKKQGNTEFSKKNYSKALDLYTEAIKACSNEPTYYANRSVCYLY